MLADAKKAVDRLENKVDFWWEPSGPLGEVTAYTEMLLDLSDKPIIMGTKLKSVELGAILHVTPNWRAGGCELATLAASILEGRDPGAIPVVPPADFDLGLNIAACLENGIVPPLRILELAGESVYR
jgi:putative ABC transport system substrate-binding protein